MRLHRVIALLICLIPVGAAAVWLEAYRFRLEQRITELSDRAEQLAEIHARLRAQLARESAPAFVMAARRLSDRAAGEAHRQEQSRVRSPGWLASPRLKSPTAEALPGTSN